VVRGQRVIVAVSCLMCSLSYDVISSYMPDPLVLTARSLQRSHLITLSFCCCTRVSRSLLLGL